MAFPPLVLDFLQVRIVIKPYFFETQRHRGHREAGRKEYLLSNETKPTLSSSLCSLCLCVSKNRILLQLGLSVYSSGVHCRGVLG